MLDELEINDINRVAEVYEGLVRSGHAKNYKELVGNDEIAKALSTLSKPNPEIVKIALKWLGGAKLDKAVLREIGPGITSAISVGKDFASVTRAIAHMYRTVDQKILVFFIDEAERLHRVTQPDAYSSWTASLRALTDLSEVGFVFFVGGKTRDELPDMLTWDEISTRIGPSNYRDLLNPGPDDIRQWITELFATLVRKGPVPQDLRGVLGSNENAPVPALIEVVGDDAEALEAYPLAPGALESFVSQIAVDDLSNKPRQILKRIQRAAGRAIKLGSPLITEEILEATKGEGY